MPRSFHDSVWEGQQTYLTESRAMMVVPAMNETRDLICRAVTFIGGRLRL